MTTPSVSIDRTASISYISSAADAQSFTEFIQFALTDTVRDSLKNKLLDATIFSGKIVALSELASRLNQYASGTYSAVSVEKIKSANQSGSSDLAQLFLNDGPKLGADLADAQSLQNTLKDFGVDIDAPQAYPVMIEQRDKEGNITSARFEWMSKDARQQLDNYDKTASQYKDSQSFEVKTDSSSTRYISFDKYTNLRPAQGDVDTALSNLSTQLVSIKDAFAKALANTAVAADRLQTLIERNKKDIKDQVVNVSSIPIQRMDILNDALKLLRKLNIELDLKRLKIQDRFSDPDNKDDSSGSNSNLNAMLSNMNNGVAGNQNIEQMAPKANETKLPQERNQ